MLSRHQVYLETHLQTDNLHFHLQELQLLCFQAKSPTWLSVSVVKDSDPQRTSTDNSDCSYQQKLTLFPHLFCGSY